MKLKSTPKFLKNKSAFFKITIFKKYNRFSSIGEQF